MRLPAVTAIAAIAINLIIPQLTVVSHGAELLDDPSFHRGFVLLCPAPGHKVECGTVHITDGANPAWQLAQWSSRYPFDSSTAVVRDDKGVLRLANKAHAVSFGGEDGILSLAVNTITEYGNRQRAAGEPWVHLLVEQRVATPPSLDNLASLRVHLEARRVRCEPGRGEGHDPRIHAAPFLIFLTVQNLEKDSQGFGNYLWFGIPVFDNRHRASQTYAAPDSAGSRMFIYTPGSTNYTSGSTHDEGWVTFDADLLPLIRTGIATAHAKDFLKGIDDDGHFKISALNMGWEVPGTFDVEMQVRRLSLTSTEKQSGRNIIDHRERLAQ